MNENGKGEYGFMGELAGSAAFRGSEIDCKNSPYIPHSLGEVDSNGIVTRTGYCFVIYLPTGPTGATATDPGSVDDGLAEKHYVAYAWPLEKGVTGQRVFVVNEKGELLFNKEALFSDPTLSPPWDEAFGRGEWGSHLDEPAWQWCD
jgi:hypothetical protein